MVTIQRFASEFLITITNGEVWLAIGLALLLGGFCLVVGTAVARTVGLLPRSAPVGDTLGVGLASGLIVLAAWWAAIWSGGRSSFTPVAVGFAIAIVLGVAGRARGARAQVRDVSDAPAPPRNLRPMILTLGASAAFIVAIALLYGSTLVPSPRDGVQPVEFNDIGFYSVLGRDLAATGTETNLSATGFPDLAGLPAQTWYHWGELWLASMPIALFGVPPLAARHLIVLPIVLLAAAALTGTVVRRMTRTASRRVFLFGFLACLFLAPIPTIGGPFFSRWAAGQIFGITLYGLAAVAVLLALYSLAVIARRKVTWAVATYVGSVVAFILPAHIAVALLALFGIGVLWAIRIGRAAIQDRGLPRVSPAWQRILIGSGAALVTTVIWGTLTDHSTGGGGGASSVVAPFNANWRDSVAITLLGSGVFLAIALAIPIVRRRAPIQAELYLGTILIVVAGAVGWGARVGEFTMFYLFFAGIAVIAAPVAAIAVRTLWEWLRATKRPALATALSIVCALQLGIGVAAGAQKLRQFGAQVEQPPIPVSILDAIRQLPSDAKLAYRCRPFEEVAFGTPQLIGIDAHTGRRVVPMCFNAEFLSMLVGAKLSDAVPGLYFQVAPQRELYPDAAARPSSEAVATFLKAHGIDYIYADPRHPNALVTDAIPVASFGEFKLLKVP